MGAATITSVKRVFPYVKDPKDLLGLKRIFEITYSSDTEIEPMINQILTNIGLTHKKSNLAKLKENQST